MLPDPTLCRPPPRELPGQQQYPAEVDGRAAATRWCLWKTASHAPVLSCVATSDARSPIHISQSNQSWMGKRCLISDDVCPENHIPYQSMSVQVVRLPSSQGSRHRNLLPNIHLIHECACSGCCVLRRQVCEAVVTAAPASVSCRHSYSPTSNRPPGCRPEAPAAVSACLAEISLQLGLC